MPVMMIVLATFVVGGVALMSLLPPLEAWAALVAMILLSLLLGKPAAVGMVIFVWAVVQRYLENFGFSPVLRFGDEMLVLLAMAIVFNLYLERRGHDPQIRLFRRMTSMLILLTLVSALINRSSPLYAGHYFLSYLAFIPVFHLVYYARQTAWFKGAVSILVCMLGVQMVLNLGWYWGVNPLPNWHAGGVDFAVGTMEGCNLVAYLTCFVMFLLLASLGRRQPPFRRMVKLGLLGICFLQLYISFTLHAYVFFALFAILQFILFYRAARYSMFFPVVALALLAVVFIALAGSSRLRDRYGYEISQELAPSNLQARWTLIKDGPKARVLKDAIVNAPRREPHYWVVGAGPANLFSAMALDRAAPLSVRYLSDIYLTYSGRQELFGGSITQAPVTSLAVVWGELGVGGALLFYGIHFLAVIRVCRLRQRNAYTDARQALLAEAFVPSMSMYIVLTLLMDFAQIDSMTMPLWIWAALVWSPLRRVEAAATATAPAAGLAVSGDVIRVLRP